MKRLLLEYQVLLSRIKEIESFIAKVGHVEKLQGAILENGKERPEQLKTLKTLGSSMLVYNAIIISIYGCFENYVDSILGVYLELLAESRKTYAELPKNLKKKYQLKLGEFLSNPGRFKNLELDIATEIGKYQELLKSNFNDTINKYFALAHSGNLHQDELFGLMSDLGISNPQEQIIELYEFKKFYLENGMDEREFSIKKARKMNEFFLPLHKLISQRNTVAHSWNVDNRIDIREIRDEIIPFVQMLCDCVFRVCASEVFSFEASSALLAEEKSIAVYNNRIVCMNNQNRKVSVGDYIVYTSADKVHVARVEKIQVEREDISCVDETQAINIGIEIDDVIKKTDKLKTIIAL